MNLVVKALELHTPELFKRKALLELSAATAEAFALPAPPICGYSYRTSLYRYAAFTNGIAQHADDPEALRERLYHSGYRLGQKFCKWMGLRTTEDVMAVARVLYRILDIDLKGVVDGRVVVSRCFFSYLYSSEVCRIMSGMDRGLLAGLAGGGDLEFTARITEGQSCCRAVFTPPKGMV